jgi:hypothetical protein
MRSHAPKKDPAQLGTTINLEKHLRANNNKAPPFAHQSVAYTTEGLLKTEA